jgi:hypothetical protein
VASAAPYASASGPSWSVSVRGSFQPVSSCTVRVLTDLMAASNSSWKCKAQTRISFGACHAKSASPKCVMINAEGAYTVLTP